MGTRLKRPDFSKSAADDFVLADLRDAISAQACLDRHFDEVYQLAADMGGSGYLFSGDSEASVMRKTIMLVQVCPRGNCSSLPFSSAAPNDSTTTASVTKMPAEMPNRMRN